MEEHKEDDASVSSALESSPNTATEMEVVVVGDDGEKPHVAGTADNEVQVQVQERVEGSSSLREEEVVEEGEGGSAADGGADIMVGVMGSDIYVDGVCIRDFGDARAVDSNGEATSSRDGSIEVCLGSEAKVLDGKSGVVSDLRSKDSVVEHASSETDAEIGETSRVEESMDEGKFSERGEVIGGAGRNDDADDKTPEEVNVVDPEPHSVDIGSGAEAASSLVDGSVGGKSQLVVEEVEVVAREERLEGVLLTRDVESSGTMEIGATDSKQLGISENQALNQRVENGDGVSSKTSGLLVAETEVLEKSELIDKTLEQAKDTDDSGGDVRHEPEKLKVDLLDDEGMDPGSEVAVVSSLTIVKDSTIVKDLSAAADVVEEDVVNGKEDFDLKAEEPVSDPLGEISVDDILEKTPVTDALEENPASHELKEIVTSSERDSTSKKVENIPNATSKYLEEPIEATAKEVVLMDNKEISCPNIEDSKSPHQLTQVDVDGEALLTGINLILNSKTDQTLRIEEPDIRNNTQVPDTDLANLQQEQKVSEYQVMFGMVNGSTKNHSNLSVNLSTSILSMQFVGEKTESMDSEIRSDPNSKTEKAEPACGDMEMDAHTALSSNDEVVSSENAIPGPTGKVLEETLEKSAACNFTQVDSNIEQVKEIQEQVTPKQFGEDEERVEEYPEPGMACASTETDNQITGGGGSDMENYEGTLNSENEFQGLAQGDQQLIAEKGLDENAAHQISDIESAEEQGMTVEEQVLDAEQFGSHEQQEMETDEQDTDAEHAKTIEERSVKQSALKSGSAAKATYAGYHPLLGDEGDFSVSDLVWGKVRSHPWWPGQIFDPSDASEKALKYYKKDCFLVAYFGDRTFAWNEASLLKPFRSHFHQVEKQSTSEAFQNAVDCALEEVARRVELGLACSCLSKDIYDKIRFQVVENTGIREESATIDSLDKFTSGVVFEPDKLVEYIKDLACYPTDCADRLELVTAKSQLLAFCRFRGYTQLSEFQFCGDLPESADGLEFQDEGTGDESPLCEDDGHTLPAQRTSQTQRIYHKRKHNLKDGFYPRKKERSISDLMGEPWDSFDDEIRSDEKAYISSVSSPSGKKRKGSESLAGDSATPEGSKTMPLAQVSNSICVPKPSFKIGECIRRVASQMTGSPSILKCNSQKVDGSGGGLVGDGSDVSVQPSDDSGIKTTIVPTEHSSLDEMLSQLHLAACDPLKGYSFLNIVFSFFTDFRNSLLVDQHDKLGGKRRKASNLGSSPATFEFEDMNDAYWTDRVIQNGSEEQPSRKYRKRENQVVPGDPDKSLRRSNSRQRYSDGKSDLSAQKPAGYVDEKAPAELVMHFPVVDSVPSETNLNKMFRRFGPIRESDTEVDKDTNRARVVFKRCSDAEAAYGSAPKFNIFGSTLVNYQLNYTISVPFKTLPIATTHGMEDATLFLEY